MLKYRSFILRTLFPLGIIGFWIVSTLLLSAGFWHALFSILFLLFVPGYFIFRTIAGNNYSPAGALGKVISYSVGLSLICLMVVGLLLNEAYVLSGFAKPLSLYPLTFSIAGVSAIFAITSSLRGNKKKKKSVKKSAVSLPLRRKLKSFRPGLYHPLIYAGLALLPLLAVGGAITLNNGGSAWLALTVMGAVAVIILLASFFTNRSNRYYSATLYSICLAILLGTSMRGWNITGHDIMQEFQVFELTIRHSAWHMQYYQDAYTACLSITILPTIFAKLTGISDPYIFKFIFQLFFALIAPIIYMTLSDYVPKRLAFLSSVVLITFPTFLTDITMLNRQETALICLALAIHAGLDKGLSPKIKSGLTFTFLAGMVLSHYSTSYVTVFILLVAILLNGLWLLAARLFSSNKKTKKKKIRAPQIFSIPVIIATALVLMAWGTIATQTSNNISTTLKGVLADITVNLGAGSNTQKVVATPAPSVPQYASATLVNRKLPSTEYYSPRIISKNQVQTAQPIVAPINKIAGMSLSKSILTLIYNLTRGVYGLFIELFIVIGLLLGVIYHKRSNLPRQYIFLGIGALFMIGIQVVLPSSLINYGLTRVIQQALIVLSLPIVLASLWALGILRISKKYREQVLAVILVSFFLVLSGFVSTLTGGYKPVLALSNSGFYYQAYYTHQDEVSSAQWLATKTPVGSRVYSDEFMRRKLITYANIFAQPTLIPSAIPIDSYAIISHGDMEFAEVPVYDNGSLIYYSVSNKFLQANKNLVYSTGTVQVYK